MKKLLICLFYLLSQHIICENTLSTISTFQNDSIYPYSSTIKYNLVSRGITNIVPIFKGDLWTHETKSAIKLACLIVSNQIPECPNINIEMYRESTSHIDFTKTKVYQCSIDELYTFHHNLIISNAQAKFLNLKSVKNIDGKIYFSPDDIFSYKYNNCSTNKYDLTTIAIRELLKILFLNHNILIKTDTKYILNSDKYKTLTSKAIINSQLNIFTNAVYFAHDPTYIYNPSIFNKNQSGIYLENIKNEDYLVTKDIPRECIDHTLPYKTLCDLYYNYLWYDGIVDVPVGTLLSNHKNIRYRVIDTTIIKNNNYTFYDFYLKNKDLYECESIFTPIQYTKEKMNNEYGRVEIKKLTGEYVILDSCIGSPLPLSINLDKIKNYNNYTRTVQGFLQARILSTPTSGDKYKPLIRYVNILTKPDKIKITSNLDYQVIAKAQCELTIYFPILYSCNTYYLKETKEIDSKITTQYITIEPYTYSKTLIIHRDENPTYTLYSKNELGTSHSNTINPMFMTIKTLNYKIENDILYLFITDEDSVIIPDQIIKTTIIDLATGQNITITNNPSIINISHFRRGFYGVVVKDVNNKTYTIKINNYFN